MLALFGAATGCEEEVEKIEKADLEQAVKKSFDEKPGGLAPEDFSIRCPGDVEAKVGAKTRCTLVATDDSEIDVVVRIRDTEGDEYKLAIKVANEGRAKIKKADLEQQVKESLTKQNGQAPKAIRCPDDIKAKVGAKTRCTLVDLDDSELDVDVRVSDVDFQSASRKFTYKFSIKVGNKRRR